MHSSVVARDESGDGFGRQGKGNASRSAQSLKERVKHAMKGNAARAEAWQASAGEHQICSHAVLCPSGWLTRCVGLQNLKARWHRRRQVLCGVGNEAADGDQSRTGGGRGRKTCSG